MGGKVVYICKGSDCRRRAEEREQLVKCIGELRVVSYQHKCRVRGSSGLLQQIHHLFGVLRIQIAGWLVCKK